MKVICKINKGSDMPSGVCKRYARAAADELIVGRAYTVYGQGLFGDCLEYLIDPDDRSGLRRPNWYPAVWFSVADNSIPGSWVYCYNNKPQPEGYIALWGYPELCIDPEHIPSLIEREEEAILIFFKRAGEIDREQEENNHREQS